MRQFARFLALAALFVPAAAHAQDPAGSGPIVAGIQQAAGVS